MNAIEQKSNLNLLLKEIFLSLQFIMKHPNFKDAQTHYEFVLGPVKIKDGLFMGD